MGEFEKQAKLIGGEMKSLEFFLDKVLPIKIFQQVNDGLHKVVKGEGLGKLIVSEFFAYQGHVINNALAVQDKHKLEFDYSRTMPPYPCIQEAKDEID